MSPRIAVRKLRWIRCCRVRLLPARIRLAKDGPMTLAALTAFTLIAFLAHGALAASSRFEQISRARQETAERRQES